MRRVFAVIVLLAGCVLYLLIGSGSWVLWLERTTFGDDVRRWHALNAATTFSDCDANLAATIRLQTSKEAPGETVERKGDSLFFRSVAHGHASVSRYVCLPGTIDPRGPKTK
jgi:hypothetical protein